MCCRVVDTLRKPCCLCGYCQDCTDKYGHDNCMYHTKEWIEKHGDTPDDTRLVPKSFINTDEQEENNGRNKNSCPSTFFIKDIA